MFRLDTVWRTIAAGALALLAAGTVTSAHASTAPTLAYFGGATDKVEMAIDVLASVGGRCGFATAPSGTVDAGSIDTTAWGTQVAFVPQCTAPWRIAVSSANGALKTGGTVATGYLARAPYTVKLNVASDVGAVTSSCPVAEIDAALSSSSCNFRGTASTSNGLYIQRSFNLPGSYIELSAPAFPGPETLIQGTYTDTLIVTISPAT